MAHLPRPLLGAALAAAAGLFFSSGGFFVRSVSVDPWEIIAVRCFFAALAVLAVLFVAERGRTFAVLRGAGWPALAAGAVTGWAIIAYVLAMQYTLVANVIAIMTTSTVIVALLARPVLGEPVPARTWLALLGSLGGVAVMFWSAMGEGGVVGNLLALSIAVAIAFQTLIVRRFRAARMEPAVLVAAVLAGVVSLPFGLPFEATAREVGLMAALGIVQLAGALTLYFYAARYLPAPTLIFVVLIDAVFAPLWVWLGFAEVPGTFVFIGAGAILVSVAANALPGLLAARPRAGRSRPGRALSRGE